MTQSHINYLLARQYQLVSTETVRLVQRCKTVSMLHADYDTLLADTESE